MNASHGSEQQMYISLIGTNAAIVSVLHTEDRMGHNRRGRDRNNGLRGRQEEMLWFVA